MVSLPLGVVCVCQPYVLKLAKQRLTAPNVSILGGWGVFRHFHHSSHTWIVVVRHSLHTYQPTNIYIDIHKKSVLSTHTLAVPAAPRCSCSELSHAMALHTPIYMLSQSEQCTAFP